MNIILSTRNPSKAEQVKGIFTGSNIKVLTLDDVGVLGDAVEDGKTLTDNALKKALYVFERSTFKEWVMADDTGLFINALKGEPGVRSARWAGEDATTDEITEFTLKQLEGVKDRSATFRTVVAVISPSGNRFYFDGEVKGQILEAPRVRPQPKMPYSPIFVPDGENLVWAEMSVEYENNISHRGQAFRAVKKFIEGYS